MSNYCIRGHRLDGDNVYVYGKYRWCVKCRRIRSREQQRRLRANATQFRQVEEKYGIRADHAA